MRIRTVKIRATRKSVAVLGACGALGLLLLALGLWHRDDTAKGLGRRNPEPAICSSAETSCSSPAASNSGTDPPS